MVCDIINSKNKKFLAMFSVVTIILFAILVIFAFNSFSDNFDGVSYYVDDLGGYNFNIPSDLHLNNSYNDSESFNKIYWANDSSYSVMISVGKNFSSEEIESLIKNNSNSYEKIKINGKEAYLTENSGSIEYYVPINNDCIYLGIWNVNGHEKLAKKILSNI